MKAPQVDDVLERFWLREAEDAQVTVGAAQVVIAYGGVIFLSSRVHDVEHHLFTVDHHVLAIRVHLGRLILVQELRNNRQRDGNESFRDGHRVALNPILYQELTREKKDQKVRYCSVARGQ